MILFQRWDSFRSPLHSILANETLLFLWVALVGLKVFHEFGHAYACKVFGGKVPEMGAYLIAFTPCAYVDASSAWGFAQLRHRVVVSLAGMYFESLVAFAALLVWNWTRRSAAEFLCPPGRGPFHGRNDWVQYQPTHALRRLLRVE